MPPRHGAGHTSTTPQPRGLPACAGGNTRAFTSFTTTRQREERQAASNHALPTFTFSSLDFAACLGAALLAGAAWAGTAEGVRAYDRGQFALAAKELQPAAQAGDPEAQFHLGLMHDFGKGVQLDHAKAAALYRKAAEQGHADAQYHLAVSCDDGEGVPQDFKQAVYWYTQAANQGLAKAQANLGVSFSTKGRRRSQGPPDGRPVVTARRRPGRL